MDNLGKEGKDKVTGFSGIIMGKCIYLYGCAQYGITHKVDEQGKNGDTCWFDAGRIEIIGEGVKKESVALPNDPGCENQIHP